MGRPLQPPRVTKYKWDAKPSPSVRPATGLGLLPLQGVSRGLSRWDSSLPALRKCQQVKVAYQDYMGGKINPDLYMRNVVWKGTTMRVISANYSADYEKTTLTLQET